MVEIQRRKCMILCVNDVGHGNHIQIVNNWCHFCSVLTIDYGSRNPSVYFPNKSVFSLCDISCFATADLLISHYHTDHYNGLVQLKDKSIYVNTLYYPYIPECSKKKKLQQLMLF